MAFQASLLKGCWNIERSSDVVYVAILDESFGDYNRWSSDFGRFV